ncbi:MAG: Asp-tRNA(Asn)/Glu-tRNA(Gln) amidotransferase GatCAB subunit B [Anaerolineae bacterium]|nr:MAG: Asp-tRNA(Asn)/Glu-tRNA(Gln) amidotransferase GatCAB subunit B [Anaerolineae bacterium]
MTYEPVIGLEVHIELQTQSKMFCACPVVDSVSAPPNTAVCPICAGHPGTLPVVNRQAVEYALRVAMALECSINPVSVFARKNYFYPDIPKGYQISQYEQPLAVNGRIVIETAEGEKAIRIRRVHLEEDTGKLTHVSADFAADGETDKRTTGESEKGYSLLDLNRAGVPLLEIVTEPDFHSAEEVRSYAERLRALVRYLGVNSGDLEKGVMRIEPNISVRKRGASELGTKVEIKNLNSFRALERGVAYEIKRHIAILEAGGKVAQETVGWDEARQATFSQRSKEDAHDYRYFPEPDLPPLVVSPDWQEAVREQLPELPWQVYRRFVDQYGLTRAEAWGLAAERAAAQYFDAVLQATTAGIRTVYAWVMGELLSLLNAAGRNFDLSPVPARELAALLNLIADGKVNQTTAKAVLAEMFKSGQSAASIVTEQGLSQVSDVDLIARLVSETLTENPAEVTSYRAGKVTVANWLFGQVMRKAGGRANPQLVRAELERQLACSG